MPWLSSLCRGCYSCNNHLIDGCYRDKMEYFSILLKLNGPLNNFKKICTGEADQVCFARVDTNLLKCSCWYQKKVRVVDNYQYDTKYFIDSWTPAQCMPPQTKASHTEDTATRFTELKPAHSILYRGEPFEYITNRSHFSLEPT